MATVCMFRFPLSNLENDVLGVVNCNIHLFPRICRRSFSLRYDKRKPFAICGSFRLLPSQLEPSMNPLYSVRYQFYNTKPRQGMHARSLERPPGISRPHSQLRTAAWHMLVVGPAPELQHEEFLPGVPEPDSGGAGLLRASVRLSGPPPPPPERLTTPTAIVVGTSKSEQSHLKQLVGVVVGQHALACRRRRSVASHDASPSPA